SLDYAWREPQRVRALLLMAPAVMGRERLDPLIRLAQSRAAPLLELLAPLMVLRSARAAVIEYAGDHEVSQRELEDQIGHARQRPRELMRGYVDILAGRDVLTPSSELEHYRSIEAPVTILRGSGDLDWTPESHEQRYRDLLANLRLERWDGVSHAPQIQAPERFRSALNAFLDKTLP
ncbi:MAG TPA: alpha/beta hydrolase, partial [Solirubrobacteraceae bacterium]